MVVWPRLRVRKLAADNLLTASSSSEHFTYCLLSHDLSIREKRDSECMMAEDVAANAYRTILNGIHDKLPILSNGWTWNMTWSALAKHAEHENWSWLEEEQMHTNSDWRGGSRKFVPDPSNHAELALRLLRDKKNIREKRRKLKREADQADAAAAVQAAATVPSGLYAWHRSD